MADDTPARVLVVEDDHDVRDALGRGLELHDFEVATAESAEAATAALARRQADVLGVDVGLPGMSGIDLCTHLRGAEVDVPILILSARDQVGDRVTGLEAGADDYLVKPFDLTELVLRLRSLLRRRPERPATAGVHTAGPIWIDEARRIVTVNGDRVALSRREFDLLSTLVVNAGIVMERVRLLELVWGYDFEVDTNVVDVFVGYLRRKLAAAGLDRAIHTVRGVGFVLRVEG